MTSAAGDNFALIEMEGPDSADFLNRLLTNEMPTQVGESRHAYYLNVQGRPLAEFWLQRSQKGFWLACPSEQVETALAELDKMHFGEKLRFSRSPLVCTLGIGPGELADCLAMEIQYLSTRTVLYWAPTAQVADVSPEQLERMRIEAGTPAPGDIGEKTMFLEIARPSDYSETKGCYPGQEVVARTLHRGHINRKLCRFTLEQPVPVGTLLLQGGKSVGHLTSVAAGEAPVPALGILRREAWQLGLKLQLEGQEKEATVAGV